MMENPIYTHAYTLKLSSGVCLRARQWDARNGKAYTRVALGRLGIPERNSPPGNFPPFSCPVHPSGLFLSPMF